MNIRLLLFYCFLFCLPSVAQPVNGIGYFRPERGFYPTGSYSISDIESVNETTDGLTLNIPLASTIPGRGEINHAVSLTYNSQIYDMRTKQLCPPALWHSFCAEVNAIESSISGGGWRYSFKYSIEIDTRPDACTEIGDDLTRLYPVRMTLILPDGSNHLLRLEGGLDQYGSDRYAYNPNGKKACPNLSGPVDLGPRSYYTTDGTFIRVVFSHQNPPTENLSWVAYFPDGRKVKGIWGSGDSVNGQQICDRNNECISIVNTLASGGDFPKTELVDSIGRKIEIRYRDVGCTNPPDCFRAEDWILTPKYNLDNVLENRNELNSNISKVKWNSISVNHIYQCEGKDSNGVNDVYACNYNGGHRIVTEVITPIANEQLKYDLSYSGGINNGWGELSSIEFPGASGNRLNASYAWRYSGPTTRVFEKLGNDLISKTVTYPEQTENATNNQSRVWTYNVTNTQSTIIHPDGLIQNNYFYDPKVPSIWSRGIVYRKEYSDGRKVEYYWAQNEPWIGTDVPNDPKNPYIRAEYKTLAGSPVKISATLYEYDKNGNVTLQKEYDWVSSVPKNGSGIANNIPTGTVIRTKQNTYARSTPSSLTNPVQNSPYTYWTSGTPDRKNSIISQKTFDGTEFSILKAVATYLYDDADTTGNITQEAYWDNVKASSFPTVLTRSSATVVDRTYKSGTPKGLLESVIDPNGNTTRYEYGSLSGCGFNNLYPTQVTTAYGTTEVQTKTFQYDCATGVVKQITDVENALSTNAEYDQHARIRFVNEAGLRQTETIYDDLNRIVTVKKDRTTYQDGLLTTVYHFNALGDLWLQRSTDDSGGFISSANTNGGIKIQTQERLTSTGRQVIQSTPYRGSPGIEGIDSVLQPTVGWTFKEYNVTGRLKFERYYSGKDRPNLWQGGTNTNYTGQTSYSYSGDTTTIQDQEGISRTLIVDALGRTKSVQDGSSTAAYGYDVLDNLTSVLQTDPSTYGSNRTVSRIFDYDSLSRLKSAMNPESGTITYTYHSDGQLHTKLDQRGNNYKATYTYDAQNRLKQTVYGNANITPTVVYCYDRKVYQSGSCTTSADPNITYGHGKLISVGSSVSESRNSWFDALGRITRSEQNIPGSNPYVFQYGFNLGDLQTSVTYPSGRVISYTPSGANRVEQVNGVKDGLTRTYASSMEYAPHGALAEMTYGTTVPVTQSWKYNGRLWMGEEKAKRSGSDFFNLTFNYKSNGNVDEQWISTGTKVYKQKYGYDATNRLSSYTETTESHPGEAARNQSYGYDGFGNWWLASQANLPTGVNVPASSGWYNIGGVTTNRMNGMTYDQAGNLTQLSPNTGEYDAENRLKKVVNGATVVAENFYDGTGKRVKKTVGSDSVIYIYDAGGNLMAEDDPGLITTGTQYLVADHLGSTRMILGSDGTCLHRIDYLPFGGESPRTEPCYGGDPPTNPSNISLKFTGKERDSETNLDYFGARYFSGMQGRFTSSDPYNLAFEISKAKGEDERAQLRDGYITNPQVWNRYAYTLNNPLRFVDPKGECSQPINQGQNDMGICIEAFIASKWIAGIGRGDDRDFSGTDASLTARSRVNLVVSPDGKVKKEVESARSGILIKGFGLKGITNVEVTQNTLNRDGSRTLDVFLIGINGESGLPFAPKGALQGTLSFTISKDGTIGLNTDGRSAVTGFPSWGAYGYEPNRAQPKVLLEASETNTQMLQRPPVPIGSKVR